MTGTRGHLDRCLRLPRLRDRPLPDLPSWMMCSARQAMLGQQLLRRQDILTKFDTLGSAAQREQQRFDMIRAVEFTMGDGVKTVRCGAPALTPHATRASPSCRTRTADILGRIFVMTELPQPVGYLFENNTSSPSTATPGRAYHAQGSRAPGSTARGRSATSSEVQTLSFII